MPGLLADLLAADDPMAPKQPHFGQGQASIFLYMTGGVSHVDSFDLPSSPRTTGRKSAASSV